MVNEALVILSGGILVLYIIEKIQKELQIRKLLKQVDKLLNRLMAKSYQEFEYYDKKFKGDIDEVEALRSEARNERDKERGVEPLNDVFREEVADEFAAKLEEDWSDEELDAKAIRKMNES